MKNSTGHIGSDVGLVATAFVMLVVGAWIAGSGGLAVVGAILVIALIALCAPLVMTDGGGRKLRRKQVRGGTASPPGDDLA